VARDTFFKNTLGQEPWELRGANDARVTALATRATTLEARGQLGYVEFGTSDQNGIGGTDTDITALSLPVTASATATHRLRLSYVLDVRTGTTDDEVIISFKEGGTALKFGFHTPGPATRIVTVTASRVLLAAGGAHTYKLTAKRGAGAGTIDIVGTLGNTNYFMVEDLGAT